MTEQDEEHIMKQTDEAKDRVLEAAEKIANQYLELDTENIDDKRIKELLNEALPVVESCEQVLGVNHPDTTELYYEIGSMYRDIKDYSHAVEWYTKGAEHGHDDAQCSLALLHQLGEGVTKNPAKAIEWYTKAAEKGNETAMFELGEIYYNGEGVKPDYAKAAGWYIKLAEKGHEYVYIQLAQCLHKTGEHKRALTWAKKAAKEYPDDNLAIYTLATIYQALDRKEEALKMFKLCLNLESGQDVSDEIKRETRRSIRKLNHGHINILELLPIELNLRTTVALITLACYLYIKTESLADTFIILLRGAVALIAFGILFKQTLGFMSQLRDCKYRFWNIPQKAWINLGLVNLGALVTFLIVLPPNYIMGIYVLILMLSAVIFLILLIVSAFL